VLFGKVGSAKTRENKQKLLAILLAASLRLLHPIAPFITEEIFSLLRDQFPDVRRTKHSDPYTEDLLHALTSPACIVAPYPMILNASHISATIENDFNRIFQIVYSLRKLRGEMQLPPSERTEVYLAGKEQLPEEQQAILFALLPISRLHLITEEDELPAFGASTLVEGFKVLIPIPESFKAKEQARLKKEQEKLEKLLSNTRMKLANEEFRAKAPEHVVQNLERTLQQTQEQLDAVRAQLS
jgi:valyl-tRNA synthetase